MNKINLDTFLDFKFLGNLAVSPDGFFYAFVSGVAHLEKNEYHHTLYLGDHKHLRSIRKLKKNNAFTFLNNHQLLINYQKNKKEEKELKDSFYQSYYIYDIPNKTLNFGFQLPIKATIEKVIGQHVILFSAELQEEDHILYEGTKSQREAYLKHKKRQSLYENIDELPYYFNGRGFKTAQKKQLFLYDMKTQKLQRITNQQFSIGVFLLSEDQETIYYTGKYPEKVSTFTSRIYAYDIKTNQHHTLYDQLDYNISDLIELSGSLVVTAKDMKSYGMNQNPDFFILKNNSLEHLAIYGESIGNSIGTDCRLLASQKSFVKDHNYYFLTTIDDHSEIKALTIDGTIKTVYQMNGSIDGFIQFKHKALMIGMKNQKLQELYTYDFDKNKIKQVTKLNEVVLKDKYVAKPIELVLKQMYHEVKGFVLLPENFNLDQKYPTILNIHGGPKTVYGSVYYHEMQYWANEGYIVIFANPRGSDGKGNDFADIRGQYGTIDYSDLMGFVDLAIQTYPIIDEQRLYVTGGSYGGFMTNWMIGHTSRFKAAVTQRSISNWVSFYGTSDIGYYFASDQTAGHPIIDMDKLYTQSPIKYVLNVKTPVLFIHSDQDLRCPIEQAQQFYAILKTQGVETKLIWIKDENHELSRSGKPQARVKRLTEITNWFKSHN